MGRIRTIKPDVFRSRDACKVSVPARWTWVGLWCFADDAGRLEDDADAIKADVYLRDRDITAEVVEGHLNELAKAGLICRYEVASRHYLHSVKFEQHQKPKNPSAPKFPPCPIQHEDEQLSLLDMGDSTPALPQDGGSPTLSSSSRKGKGSGRDATPHRGYRLPQDWKPSLQLLAWAKDRHPSVDAGLQTEKFINHWLAASGSTASKRDWDAAWRNWIIHAEEWASSRKPGYSGPVVTERGTW
jgi:hypothetical protein